jgi:hypothetical protein
LKEGEREEKRGTKNNDDDEEMREETMRGPREGVPTHGTAKA